jgi:hypothetical protein
MSLASLLVLNDSPNEQANFAFEHMMSHRQFLGAMAPLTRFSVLPYNLDPFHDNKMWLRRHQTAQTDAISTVPTWGLINPPEGPPYPGTLTVSAPENKLLEVTDWSNARQRAWFVFANHQEHYVTTNSLPPVLTYPFD